MISRAEAISPGRAWAYRLAIPVAALCVFGLVALLWVAGLQSFALSALRALGVVPGPFPFIDTHYVLAAAECQHYGSDVYFSNPCDVYGRVYAYSPLWLTLIPPMLGTAATPWVGATLDVLFILSLYLLMRPRSAGELVVLGSAVFSPTVLYALERANVDLIMFLLVLGAGLLQAARRGWRPWSYALIVAAALLKYYPAVLLVLAARERRRDALLVCGAALAAFASFATYYHGVLGHALANIPRFDDYRQSIGAQNLPRGLARLLWPRDDPMPLTAALLGMLSLLAGFRAISAAALLDAVAINWKSPELRFSAIGALLLIGCFFSAQNLDYRGIYLLMVVPGLLRLRAAAQDVETQRLLSRVIGVGLLAMWARCLGYALMRLDAPLHSPALMAYWLARQLLWWWLIGALAGIVLCAALRPPPLRRGATWLDRFSLRLKAALPPGITRPEKP